MSSLSSLTCVGWKTIFDDTKQQGTCPLCANPSNSFSLYLESRVWVESLYLMTPNNKELVPCVFTHPTPFLSIITHMCGLKGYIWWHQTRDLSLMLCVLTHGTPLLSPAPWILPLLFFIVWSEPVLGGCWCLGKTSHSCL